MPEGNVKWYNKIKGYGFVGYEDRDIFIHYSNMIDHKYVPETNDIISFDIVDGEKGLKAQNITRIKIERLYFSQRSIKIRQLSYNIIS